tara:strand:+ start:2256 stop:3932 length:1677 start_codon:yes stop_codon:yes gene_type:complete
MKEKVIIELEKITPLKKKQISSLIEIPPSIDLGDYAFPCFILSKKLKQSPDKIASSLVDKIKSKDFEKVEAKGPYINFFVDKIQLVSSTLSKISKQKDNYGSSNQKQKVVIEFPSPNTNKPLHIGHARNIVLGQALLNILKFSGNKIIITNLNNDRGIHICKSIVAYQKFGKSSTPEKANKKPDHFVGDYYVKYSEALKKDKSLETQAKQCLQLWEKKDKKTLSLWKKMNSWAYQGFKQTYKKFDYSPDKEFFESKIYDKGKSLILKNKKIINQKQDGAYYINLEKEGLGEKILLRKDGTSVYITQDLYLALLKEKEFHPDLSIYITGSEQDYHFNVLFSILKRFGYNSSKLRHLSHGMVNLESGRMKSREGTVVDSDDIMEELESLALKEIESRYKSLSPKEKTSRANSIALSALRYYFLKIEKIKDMVFKPEESISFEGNTGPYLLYTYARARSILRKAKYKPKKFTIPTLSTSEKELVLLLDSFPEIVQKSYNDLAPNLIANSSYELAKKFNEFYHQEKVIGSDQETFRLALVDAFSQVLKNSLKLLNINVIEKM